MTRHLLVVDRPRDLELIPTDLPAVTARDYIGESRYSDDKRLRIINLCRSFRYLSTGYYVSLLAEARGQRVLPTVRGMLDLERQNLYHPLGENLSKRMQTALQKHGADLSELDVPIYFGRCSMSGLQELARLVFEAFPFPALMLSLQHHSAWRVAGIAPAGIHQMTDEQHSDWLHSLNAYLFKGYRSRRNQKPSRYDLAVLHDPNEKLAPSNLAALQKLVKAGQKQGVNVELIQRRDFSDLAEYDALFIRETTRINHHTYRFSRKAEAEGLVVIDDPNSILKCTNKVFLAELLRAHKIPTPRTLILRKENIDEAERDLGFPVVLKIPDSAFSQGVFKADNREALHNMANALFKKSELVLAQEFVYTPFDWRIGLLDRQPLYACRYFMSKRHWQIVNHAKQGRDATGMAETLAIEQAPKEVVKIAKRAADLIGDGLYGVDLKETERGVMLIEINDNPSIDAGIEDKVLGNRLYDTLISAFIKRLERKRALWVGN